MSEQIGEVIQRLSDEVDKLTKSNESLRAEADRLADHLDLAIAGLNGANVDINFLENRLKEYRGGKS